MAHQVEGTRQHTTTIQQSTVDGDNERSTTGIFWSGVGMGIVADLFLPAALSPLTVDTTQTTTGHPEERSDALFRHSTVIRLPDLGVSMKFRGTSTICHSILDKITSHMMFQRRSIIGFATRDQTCPCISALIQASVLAKNYSGSIPLLRELESTVSCPPKQPWNRWSRSLSRILLTNHSQCYKLGP